MVWRIPNPSKGGTWVGPGVVIQNHHGTVWTPMRESLWKCTSIQCQLAEDDEACGLEIQNVLLHDLRADLQDNRGRKSYTDVSREESPIAPAAEQDPPAQQPAPEVEVVGRDLPPIPEEEEEATLPDDNPLLRPAPMRAGSSRVSTATPDDGNSVLSTPSLASEPLAEPKAKRSRTTRRGKRRPHPMVVTKANQ